MIVFREAEATFRKWIDHEDCHPVFENYEIPLAAEDEILIEKTPEIVNGNYSQLLGRSKCMKKTNPKVKILVMICDPTKRYISHTKHVLGGYYNDFLRDLETVKMTQADVNYMLYKGTYMGGNNEHLSKPT